VIGNQMQLISKANNKLQWLKWRLTHSRRLQDFVAHFRKSQEFSTTGKQKFRDEQYDTTMFVYLLERMGDIIVSTAVIRELRRQYPKVFITFGTKRQYAEILRGNEMIDEIIYCRDVTDVENLLDERDFDKVICLHIIDAYTAPIFAPVEERAKNIPKSVGSWYSWGRHLIDLYAENAQVELTEKRSYVPIKENEKKYVDKILKKHGVGEDDLVIAFHTKAGEPEKTWAHEHFVRLADLILDEFDAWIVVLGGKGEGPIERERVINLAGKLSIKQTGAALMRSRLLVGLVSGVSHLADAVGTFSIILFGSELPEWGGRPLQENYIPIQSSTSCKPPCGHPCTKSTFCIDDIEPEVVFAAVRKFIGEE